MCTNEDGWGDGAKVPTCFPASTENIHKPRDMIRGSEQPEKRLVELFLGFQGIMATLPQEELWLPNYAWKISFQISVKTHVT